MNFVSIQFICFVCIAVLLYYVFPPKKRWWIILLSSIVFYGLNGKIYLLYIAVTTVITWLAARYFGYLDFKLEKSISGVEDKELIARQKAKNKRQKKLVMLVTLLAALGLLGYTKYTNFIISNINLFTKAEFDTIDNIIVPLGVSFYTFMSIGYMLDVYWKKYEPEKNLLKYATFITYFPHIVQGPIDRYNKLAPDIFGEKKFDFDRLRSGFELIIWGFFQKLVIANRLNIFVDSVFSNYEDYYGVVWVVTLALYSVQTYADFSGCMDIARGVSELFGITLQKNFDHPYFAKTIPEFWRRWHISMGEWFKDYLFLPISNSKFVKKNSKKIGKKWGTKARRNFVSCFPVIFVWLATGIWHGAGWTFLCWGIYHGILTTCSTLFADQFEKANAFLHIKTDTFAWRLFQMIRTFTLCCIGRIFFRAESIGVALTIFKNMFTKVNLYMLFDQSIYTWGGLDRPDFMMALISICIMWAVSMMQVRFSVREKINSQNIVFRYSILYLAIFSVIIFGVYGSGYDASSFIYGQF